MKQSTIITRITMLILFLGIFLYLGIYVVKGLQTPFRTVLTYRYTVSDSAEATGFLVRDETVVLGSGVLADVLPDEGEKVGAGQAVAVLYQNSAALDRKQEIRALKLELEQLDYALGRNDGMGDATQMDAEITSILAQLQHSVSAGNLSGLEENTLSLRSLVLKRTDTYQSTADSLASIEASIGVVTDQLRALSAVSNQESSKILAERAGIFSGLADGYEALLTPALLERMTPQDFRTLSAKKVPTNEAAIGKLITSARWQFVTLLDEAVASRLQEGESIPVLFSHDFSGEITMRIDRVSLPADGTCVVVLSSNRALSATTLLRRQTVDLIFKSYTGVRVPKEAVRVITKTKTDPETKVETQYQVSGVFVLVGAQAELKPVQVIQEREDFYIVQGTATDRKVLRAGDEVILSSQPLYDGKVIE